MNSQSNEHFVSKTSTPEAEKDSWQTPRYLFNALNIEFGFTLDVCASDENSLCDHHFTKEDNALVQQWYCYSAFMNPPYSQTLEFLAKASQQAKQLDITVVALVNANTDTKWFSKAVCSAQEIRLITGRIGFIRSDGKKANGNTKGQCLIIWRGNSASNCEITMVDRNYLMVMGK